MRATLNATGNWTIKVRNPGGGQSSIFSFGVNGGTNPIISNINPIAPITSGADQNVIVNGSNFQNGLRVNVSFPNGGIATLQGTGQIQNVTANSFLMRITLNAAGSWSIRVVNPDNSQSAQFTFNVQSSILPPTGLPTSVLSPVIGSLRVTTTNQQINDGKWEFNQHKTGDHTPTGGISLSNDTFAWDVNLYTSTNGNADAGKAVFAVADGQVISYVGTPPGGGFGAVLIAHPNASNPVWFSGYLYMNNVRVILNQTVTPTTIIGEIGRVGTENDQLHFVVYSGQNTRGNLQSFNTTITERPLNTTNPPVITSVEPSTVNQSSVPQFITISGSNFHSNSMIEMEGPNGQYFTVTPETVSGFDDESRIVNVTPTSITARITFSAGGNYEFSVITVSTNLNSNGSTINSFNISSSSTVYAIPSNRTPIILIPGIMGSRISKREGNTLKNLWLGGAASGIFSGNQAELRNNVEDASPNAYRSLGNREVVATEILRNLSTVGGLTVPKTDVYDKLITYLTSQSGLGYKLYNDNVPNKRRIEDGCDVSQIDADLFIFPYDWRNSNWTSSRDLYEFVKCIKSIRYPNQPNPPNFKVDIIAHSMGGIVARRYILNNPNSHYVDRVVTLGTPWLGAPKAINTLESGGKWLDWQSLVIRPDIIKSIAPNIRGSHELIPSRAYVDELTDTNTPFELRFDHPLGEDGWNDFDCPNPSPIVYQCGTPSSSASEYNFNLLRETMNRRYANRPGDTTNILHQGLQDNWNGDTSGVSYYNFVGYGKNTIVSLKAKRGFWGNKLDPIELTQGDGTVPLLSALRKGRQDFRGPIRLEKGFPLEHGDLASENRPGASSTFKFIGCVIDSPNPDVCINNQSIAHKEVKDSKDFIGEPNYLLKVIGSDSINISDSFGNTTAPFSTSFDEGVKTVRTEVIDERLLSATFKLDQHYKVVIKVPSTPFSIILTKNDGETITQAIRYIDIILPANVLALLEITPQNVMILKYDSDGNGTFGTSFNPTITVTGTQAQDIESPVVVVNETVQNGTSQIVLEATDTGAGVRQIMYSLNGTSFQQYSTPLTLNSAQTPAIYVFADDNVFNRSGLITHNLITSNIGFNLVAPSTATPGSQIAVNWNAPNGRPDDDWIGLFRIGTLNSTYISKQYTGGQTSGNLSFNLPNQTGTYEFRYLINDGFSSVAISNPIVVSNTRRSLFDFDGDSRSDISVFRSSNGAWYLLNSTQGFSGLQFGISTDKLVPGDYDGDGKTDVAVYRNGIWYLQRSSQGFTGVAFGGGSDIPVPADYDGDGRAELAVFRPSNGCWYILNLATSQFTAIPFGQSGDKPIPADYDGDAKADIAVNRNGNWYIQRSQLGFTGVQFGDGNDKSVPADYDGDGKADIAVFRPSNGTWYLLQSSNGFAGIAFGFGTDVPVPADYDGDGKTDVAVFRNGIWYLQKSTTGFTSVQFGVGTDIAIPNAYIP